LLFILGVLMNYFIIFPFAFRFLFNYQVYSEVYNQISLSSYISNLLMLSLLMGILFEIPIVNYLLAKAGLLQAETLKKYRRHAIVGIAIVAAVITPTGDAVTLTLVTLPIYLLYEASILIVKRVQASEQPPDPKTS
jgi:sec-independent protein translocase protein TatC